MNELNDIEEIHRSLYKKIPDMGYKCLKGCNKCCVPVVLSDWEAERLGLKGHRFTPKNPNNGKCLFFSVNGCSVYDKRPFVCRMFGASKDPSLRCPVNVKADKPLTRIETIDITNDYFDDILSEETVNELRERL